MTYPIDLTIAPPGYELLKSEPDFDPARHLALEKPDQIYTLADFGYDEQDISDSPSPLAATSVFRVLSPEGASCLLDVARQLSAFTRSNPRIERCTRGGVYRSKFLRDLCLSEDVNVFLSDIADVDLLPHTIPHQLGHLNYNPTIVGEDVDKWHTDTLRFDYVMFVTDPNSVEGGEFQYFRGTKDEMADLKARGETVPPQQVIAPSMPGPGYAVLQQGNLVVHQAKGLRKPGERITMVNGYIAKNTPDFSRYDQLIHVDPPEVVTAEYARHIALQHSRSLVAPSFSEDRETYASALDAMGPEYGSYANEIRQAKSETMEHYGI